MKPKLLFWLIPFLFLLSFSSLLSQESPLITVTPQAYTKLIIRIPPFEGEKEEELSSLLRKLINYHLFCVALKEPPFQGLKERGYYLKGTFKKEGIKYLFQGELIDLLEGNPVKRYQIEASSKERLAYALCDEIIRAVSSYQGVANTRLAFVKREKSGDRLYLIDFSKRNLKELARAELILFPRFSPSGRKLAYLFYEKGHYFLEIFSFDNGSFQRFLLSDLASSPLWSPSEETLYLTLGKGDAVNIYQFDLKTQKLSPITSGKGIHQAGSISPDGRFLAYVGDLSGSPQIYLLDLEKGSTKRISFEGKYHTSPRFSPKGNLLLYLSSERGKNFLILYNLKTGEKKKLHLSGLHLSDPSFSPSGDYLIFKAKGKEGEGLYLLHLDSLLYHNYLPYGNLYYPEWGKLF